MIRQFIRIRHVRARTALACIATCLLVTEPSFALEPQPVGQSASTFAELETAGTVIRRIRIDAQNIFDLNDREENNWLFRTANKLHVKTRPQVIEQLLLFKVGERISAQKIEETERLLRNVRFIYDVEIKPEAQADGMVDIAVTTRDTWTIDAAGSVSRSGGNNKTSFGVKEYNLFGSGLRVGFSRTSDADRKGNEFEVSYPQAFDGWTQVSYTQARFDDGKRKAAAIVRPFYALDTRWAYGATFNNDDRIDSIYNAGETVSQYRHRQKFAEVFGGYSPGLINGWTQRFLIGGRLRDDEYALEPGRVFSTIAPALLPVKQDQHAVFFRHEIVEDQFVKLKNRDQIARPEFFRLGFNSQVQITRSLESLGSTRSAWQYFASVSNGFAFASNRNLLVSGLVEQRIASTGAAMTQVGGVARYYIPQGNAALFYAALSADRISGGGLADQLLLGGSNGLRGYKSRYQAGERRALLALEQRAYTDWYPFRLLRVGGAVFFDVGRAWGGLNQNIANPGWLADVGVGLRIALDRAAFANVLHADIAVPLNRAPGIKPVQFLVKTEITF